MADLRNRICIKFYVNLDKTACKPSNAVHIAWKAKLHLRTLNVQVAYHHVRRMEIGKIVSSFHNDTWYFTHFQQQCHNSKLFIFQEQCLKVLKCYNFLWVQWWHNCSPAASFATCVTYDTIPVKSASANVSFCASNSKTPNFELWHSCRKWAIWLMTFVTFCAYHMVHSDTF